MAGLALVPSAAHFVPANMQYVSKLTTLYAIATTNSWLAWRQRRVFFPQSFCQIAIGKTSISYSDCQ